MTRYYLDTSAHIERWMGEESVQSEIRTLLAGESHATSSHALREWTRIVDGGCGAVLNAFRDGTASLGDVFARLSQAGYGRSPGQALRVLSLLIGGGDQLGPDAEIRARRILRTQSRAMFTDQINEVRDGSECGLARERVRTGADGRLELKDRCKKTENICRRDTHLEELKPLLDTVGQALKDDSPSDRKRDRDMGALALKMVKDRSQRKGKNCYGLTGDVSMVLECGKDEVLLTTDRSFDVSAPALGLTHHRLTPTQPP